jgi:hypothetical protein
VANHFNISEAENLKVYFAGFAEGRKEKFMRSVGPLPELLVNHMILAPDFEKYFIKACHT